MAVNNMTEDSDGTNSARGKPGMSNRCVGTGNGYMGRGGVEGVVCGAAAAIGHGFGGGWVAGGERENEAVFCKMSPLRTHPPFSAQC